MRLRVRTFAVSGLLLVPTLSGCPLSDRYFIDSGHAGETSESGAGGSGGRAPRGGAPQGGSSMVKPGPKPLAGANNAYGGDSGMGPSPTGCVPATERCNGHDDNCNEVVDEQACNSQENGTSGCAGFVIPGRPDHGYMLCTTGPRDYAEAQLACQQQNMRLAWIETDAENRAVSAKVKALTSDEAWIGASDGASEGDWVWDGAGGYQFWIGKEDGQLVGRGFAAWMSGTPNDDNGGEDCAVLNAMTDLWGDRSCSTRYAYLCEEPDQ